MTREVKYAFTRGKRYMYVALPMFNCPTLYISPCDQQYQLVKSFLENAEDVSLKNMCQEIPFCGTVMFDIISGTHVVNFKDGKIHNGKNGVAIRLFKSSKVIGDIFAKDGICSGKFFRFGNTTKTKPAYFGHTIEPFKINLISAPQILKDAKFKDGTIVTTLWHHGFVQIGDHKVDYKTVREYSQRIGVKISDLTEIDVFQMQLENPTACTDYGQLILNIGDAWVISR